MTNERTDGVRREARWLVALGLLVALGCRSSPASPPVVAEPTVVSATPTASLPAPASSALAASAPAASAPTVCVPEPPGSQRQADDVDGDGTPDFIDVGYSEIKVYLRRDGCLSLLATIEVGGHIAFVHVLTKKEPGVRDLSVDTWLIHGDRKRTRVRWNGHGYGAFGVDEEIPGPRRSTR